MNTYADYHLPSTVPRNDITYLSLPLWFMNVECRTATPGLRPNLRSRRHKAGSGVGDLWELISWTKAGLKGTRLIPVAKRRMGAYFAGGYLNRVPYKPLDICLD